MLVPVRLRPSAPSYLLNLTLCCIKVKTTTTICAIATGISQGGVGIVRVSGSLCESIAQKMLGFLPKERYAHYGWFFNQNGEKIDKGIALYFPAPNSFTGESVLEFQGHGGLVVMREILASIVKLGGVYAQSGEFSKRAFLNGKMDLVQVEAVADMIEANSTQAAKSALKSLSGLFSKQVKELSEAIINLRVFIEASIDFVDEEIDFLQFEQIKSKAQKIRLKIVQILSSAEQGYILRDGLNVVIAGKPNVGKSSLLNALVQNQSAIVTDIAGTTRDSIKENININGIPLHIIDTAGLHGSNDEVEKLGIERAKNEIKNADAIMLVVDAQDSDIDYTILPKEVASKPMLLIKNKIDLKAQKAKKIQTNKHIQINISAKNNQGIDLIKNELSKIAGINDNTDGVILARKRQIIALESALSAIDDASIQLENQSLELAAEDLRLAGQFMGSITGEFLADDLLGEIFSSFCIGK